MNKLTTKYPAKSMRIKNKKYGRQAIFSTQRGYFMISILIALVVTSVLLTLYAQRQAENSRLERGDQVGYALNALGKGLNLYIDTYAANLVSALPVIQGVADALHPTASELIQTIGIDGVAPIPPTISGAAYKFRVHYPADCTSQKLSKSRCRPVGLVYINKPLTRNNHKDVDYMALARAVRVMEGRGGYSTADDPAYFTFLDSAVSKALIPIANPANAAGLLAWRADTLLSPDSGGDYLRTDGLNRMNATLRFRGANVQHDLQGVGRLEASKLFSDSLEISGEKNVTGDSLINGHSLIMGNQTINGRLIINSGPSGYGGLWTNNIKASGDVVLENRLQILGSGLWTTDLDASENAKFGGAIRVAENTTSSHLFFTQPSEAGRPCYNMEHSLGMVEGPRFFWDQPKDLLVCRNGRWEYLLQNTMNWNSSHVEEVVLAPGKHFVGRAVFCRRADKHSPQPELTWNSDRHLWEAESTDWDRAICFGSYSELSELTRNPIKKL